MIPIDDVLSNRSGLWQASWCDLARQLEHSADTVEIRRAVQLATTQGFVFARRQLPALGVTDALFRRQLRRGAWRMVMHGAATVIPAGYWDGPDSDEFARIRREHALRAASVLLARPEHLVTGRSAAILHGVPTRKVPPEPILTSRHGISAGRFGNRLVRRATLRPWDDGRWFGVALTPVARTVLDLARLDGGEGLMATDSALRDGLIRPDDLYRAVRWLAGWPGVRAAREVIELADPLAESPLESLVRWALHRSRPRLPQPELQIELRGSSGRLYRVDFLWRAQRLVLEADGRIKYEGAQLWQEKTRELDLVRAGYRVERVLWQDLDRDAWQSLTTRLRAHLLPSNDHNAGPDVVI